MGRRILAFFLGMIFGMIFLVGALAGGLVILATLVRPSDFTTDARKFLGDLADLSFFDIYNQLSLLYAEQTGTGFTFGEFCEKYNIDPNEMFGGKQVRDEILEIPIFDLFGENGGTQQLKVSVIPALVNMFVDGGTDEEGNPQPLFGDSLMDKLSQHTIAELSEENGIANVFAEVRLAEVALGMLPLEQTEENALMWAVGQAKLGPIIGGGLTGNILNEFKDGGALDELGKMPIVKMLGGSSQYINAFLGNNAIADMIDEEGNLNPDSVINGVYLGDVVSLHRNQFVSCEGYDPTSLQNDNVTLYKNVTDKYLFETVVDGQSFFYEAQQICNKEEHQHTAECNGETEGEYTCGKEEHEHTIDCYGYVWYNADDEVATGIYAAIADVTVGMLTSGEQDALINKFMNIPIRDLVGDSVETGGVMENFLDYTIGELMNGNAFDKMYLGQLLGLSRGDEVTDTENYHNYGDVKGVMQNDEGNYIKRDGDVWYPAKLTCNNEDEEHVHTADCFGYVWLTESEANATGLYAALADITVGELMGGDNNILMDKLTNIPLRELLEGQEMSGIFENIADMTIGELMDGGIDNMYLGQLLGFELHSIDMPEGDVTELYKTEPHGDEKPSKYLINDGDGNVLGLSMDGKTWYEGKICCGKEEHTHGDECGSPVDGKYPCGKEEHTHNVAGCYGFVWYEECQLEENEQHHHSDDLVIDGKNMTPCVGMMDKLANKQIADLSNLDDMLKEFTLGDVMGDSLPGMLGGLKDTPIGELDKAIDELYLGQLLEYRRKDETEIEDFADFTTDVITDEAGNAIVKSNGADRYVRQEGKTWYEAALTCTKTEEHEHTAECYAYVWYKVCEQTEEHDHSGEWLPKTDNPDNNYYIVADGMMGKLANEKVSNLGNLNETVQTFTLYDVLGENVPSMLKDIQDQPINNLEEAINTLYLGQLLGYTKGEGEEGNFAWTKEDGTEVTGMMLKLANKKVEELGDLDKTIKEFTLEDVLGEDIPESLKSLKDTPIGELDTAIDEMYLGAFLGYRRRTSDELDTAIEHYKHDVSATEGDAVKLDDEGNAIKLDGETWYEATLTCTKTGEHEHTTACYGYVWYKECTTDGEHDHSGEWQPETDNAEGKYFVVADGMMGKLANEKINNIGNLNETVLTFTLRDVMGDSIPAALASLGDTPIGDLGTAMDGMYLGSFLQYRRRPVEVSDYTDVVPDVIKSKTTDGATLYAILEDGVWYEAKLTCNKIGGDHVHTAECFVVLWYQECTQEHDHSDDWAVEEGGTTKYYEPANNLLGRMSVLTISELSGDKIKDIVNDTELGEVLPIDANTNAMLKELATIKIGDLNNELEGIYVGVAMGFERNIIERNGAEWEHLYTDDDEDHNRKDEVYKDAEDNYYIRNVKHDTYYEAQLICDGKEDGGIHTFKCFGYVWYDCHAYLPGGKTLAPDHKHGAHEDEYECERAKGLNEKVSNLRIDELNGDGLTGIATGLTMGDLIDSGMVELGEDEPTQRENEYKLALLTCKHDEDGITCNLADYLVKSAASAKAGRTLTAEEYWENAHNSMGALKDAHRDQWRDIALSNFISDILQALTITPEMP